MSVAHDQVDAFAAAFDEALAGIQEDANATPLYIEGACSIEDLDILNIQELERLGPFGPGNPEPVFKFRAAVRDHTVLKGRHLKMNLTAPPQVIEAIWFHAAEREEFMKGLDSQDSESEWAGVPEINRFRGRMTPTFRVRDWRKFSPEV